MNSVVKGFQGRYRFLSNFYPYPVEFEGRKYLSSEAAYQASKVIVEHMKGQFLQLNALPSLSFLLHCMLTNSRLAINPPRIAS